MNLDKWLRGFGLEICEVCGSIGIRFTTPEPIVYRKLAATHTGWLHPEVEPPSIEPNPDSPFDITEVYGNALANAFSQALVIRSPLKFCLSPNVSVETAKHRTCPKCGEPGWGKREYQGQRRFWHSENRSCYIGMTQPKRIRETETECPKCHKPGRRFVSKGYEFIRHKSGQCRVGKLD